MSSQQVSYCHAGNAAKFIHFVSTGSGIALGLVSTKQYFDQEYWTPEQIASMSIPVILAVGTQYRHFCNMRPKHGPSIPLPFVAGEAIGVIGYTSKVNLSACSTVVNCVNEALGLFSKCESAIDACLNMVDSQESWNYVGQVTTDDGTYMYCDPTAPQPTGYTSLNKVAKLICNRLLDLNPYQEWIICKEAFNLNQQSIDQIAAMRVTLFNNSQCNPGSAYSGIEHADVILFIGISVLFVTVTLCLHPLAVDPRTRAFKANVINPEKDPIFSELVQEAPRGKIEVILDNV